ncbi:Spy/CpxP family protein refolding chaperone [Phormidium sp. FACHB-1136]|uniref:Spy/CpxP family protein refolding chaperone n=1 Tax=Phormidium sp. FACHB-1136 TaxID=2692848 RepID=UPI001681F90B|nr:Spy/CpxP family protein refolding chaperone [Phormidium sp. FACHB-1136]MBD2425689.1 hypothetical protein [Phormidium sp. FACHB-1136]
MGVSSSALAQTTSAPAETQPQSTEDLDVDDLTDDQAAQMEAIFDAYEPQIAEATANYLAALEMMNNLLVPTTADLALSDAHDQVLTTRQALDTVVFERNLALRSVLNLDQRQVINDYVRAYLGLAPAEPMAVFPENLIGQDINTVLDELWADGWEVMVEMPSEVQLDRGAEQLDLALDRSGQIIDVRFSD